ncbi:MAG: FMN-binding protein [Pseudomonadales bacterium]|jgi:electron transport complex protein RnfG|nr:FMN-binding protein [Pseudomonadales bacterium]MDP7359428.1 FMN-binding protein [Pseudomonadales bacterium]MDP7597539.1 FMN-binding protein [Pseudomonadales bacterium]HJN51024.1 FMN-binding protein [Pseudomonadales bacterium]|tara:strand:- start:1898 stop:2632 length:735 start_codon:yes stop_codon:yes gene_type:complete
MNESQNAIALEGTSPRVAAVMISVLAGIAAFCGLLIVLTFEATLPTIKKNQAEYLRQSIFEVLPNAHTVRKFQRSDAPSQGLESTRESGPILVPLVGEESGDELMVYATYDPSGELVGVALEASGQGYQDVIKVLYGYQPSSQQIVGMKVLASKETPGLGDKIELDPTFRRNFLQLDAKLDDTGQVLANEIVTVKAGAKKNGWEIDGITGATISSKAIGRILNASAADRLPVIARNLSRLEAEK